MFLESRKIQSRVRYVNGIVSCPEAVIRIVFNPTEAIENVEEISKANDILGDPDRRRIYDAFGASEFHNRNAYENAVKQGAVKRIVGGFYKNSPSVKTITSGTFIRDVYSKQATLVEFYSPWCYHCQQMVGEFKKTAILLEADNIAAGAVDCDANRMCQQLRITSYPTIRFFPGHRKAQGMGITYKEITNHMPYVRLWTVS